MNKLTSALCLLLAGGCNNLLAENTLSQALSAGDVDLNFRLRYEGVDQNGLGDTANALTLRSRLTYQSADYRGFKGILELDDVSYLSDDDFNNTRNGKASYPVVADPDGTDLNQFAIQYQSESLMMKLGRQRINVDNQRFIGGVGWRQNEQTYDALMIEGTGFEDISMTYVYISGVSRVFGPEEGTPDKYLDSDSHIVHIGYKPTEKRSVVAYGYFLDLEDAPGVSASTLGIRFSDEYAIGDLTIPLTAEYARQSDYGSNTATYTAGYYALDTGLSMLKVSVSIGFEVLEGDRVAAGEAFSTPLATLHKFQGWTDKFLSTPGQGVEDIYFQAGVKAGEGKIILAYHDFNAESSAADYGQEIDLSYSRKLNEHFSVLVKYADYNADKFSTDTRKLWLMLTMNF
ncbi:MAG: alginate export family protein [Pseudomonadales bacterium]|nr:alginate export family protein [Pseudomonadales bacterium]